jgi:Ca2+-binding RTX toxin-like protein
LLRGSAGNDTLNGKAGVDVLNGGSGNDNFVFDMLGSANRDIVQDFVSGADKLQMENSVMTAIGSTGNFAAGDARFFAAAGATAGHDANDRIVYNSTTGDLYYDADGNGTGAAQFVGNISGHPALAATDIAVI